MLSIILLLLTLLVFTSIVLYMLIPKVIYSEQGSKPMLIKYSFDIPTLGQIISYKKKCFTVIQIIHFIDEKSYRIYVKPFNN